MPPVLLPPLLLAQPETAGLLRLPGFPGEGAVLLLVLLPLELERLLGLGAYAGALGLLPGQPLGAFGVARSLPGPFRWK